ncbi:ABC transporter permease [Enterococcus sp. AZ196]|uniref:ABC transporter permease n=1 Tax=Enterococcus sp. AZ196 TaxID=2774659 RepID=UPI003D2C177A
MREGSLLRDSRTMFIRSLKLSFRSPSAIALALMMPASILAIFVYVFGGAMDLGGVSVANYIVPGVIVLTILQSTPAISVRLNNDMTKGVIDRFRTMPIAKASILVGHVTAAILQSIITAGIAICVSLLVGFRPQAGVTEWIIAVVIIILYIVMAMWLAVLIGVFAKTSEEASGYMQLIGVLPFLSSAFVPTETMPRVLRIVAENQPMTPIIDTVRALLLSQHLATSTLGMALIWCISLAVVFCVSALHIYKQKAAQ